jgi:hypothetical protein
MMTFEWATPAGLEGMKLRDADIAELAITSPGQDPHDLLRQAVECSYFAELVRVDGKPALVYGVGQTQVYGVGSVWMLASDDIKLIRKQFVAGCREKVEMMNRMFPVLCNWVHSENTVAVNWLRWLGFEVQAADSRGMCYFQRGQNNV